MEDYILNVSEFYIVLNSMLLAVQVLLHLEHNPEEIADGEQANYKEKIEGITRLYKKMADSTTIPDELNEEMDEVLKSIPASYAAAPTPDQAQENTPPCSGEEGD